MHQIRITNHRNQTRVPCCVCNRSSPTEMEYELILFLTVFAMSYGSVIPAMTIAHTPQISATVIDYHNPHPRYNFAYDVHDPTTGDIKRQQESRNGDVVHGQYSLIEPDGSRRTVDYAADGINGFNAIINREQPVTQPPQIHTQNIVQSSETIVSRTPIISATAQASAIIHPQQIITQQPQVIVHQRPIIAHPQPIILQQPAISPQQSQIIVNQSQGIPHQQPSFAHTSSVITRTSPVTAHPPILNTHITSETPVTYNHPNIVSAYGQ